MTLLGVGVDVGAALGLGYLFVQWTGGVKVSRAGPEPELMDLPPRRFQEQ
jgi:hypothetical protein